jgi:hypothetical protein
MTPVSFRPAMLFTRAFWVDTGKPELKNPDAAFIGFGKSRYKVNAPRSDPGVLNTKRLDHSAGSKNRSPA